MLCAPPPPRYYGFVHHKQLKLLIANGKSAHHRRSIADVKLLISLELWMPSISFLGVFQIFLFQYVKIFLLFWQTFDFVFPPSTNKSPSLMPKSFVLFKIAFTEVVAFTFGTSFLLETHLAVLAPYEGQQNDYPFRGVIKLAHKVTKPLVGILVDIGLC